MRSFRRVLCTTLAFLLLVGALSVAFMEAYFRSEYDSFQDISARDRLAGSLDLLICGASHGYRAFDPAVMDPILGTSGYNISSAMMTMQGRYELLKAELDRNPVRTVILELSYNSMTRNRKNEGMEGDLYVMAKLPGFWRRAGFFFRGFYASEYPDVYYKFVTEGIDALARLLRGEEADHSAMSRGYLPTGPRQEALRTDYDAYWHQRELGTEADPYNEEYLDRILRLCRERDVRVILITTPISKAYLARYYNFQEIYDGYRALAAEWGLTYYDFNLWKQRDERFPDETRFFDETHLNQEGAAEFSALVAEYLKREAAGEDLSAAFFKSYDEMELAVFGC